MNDVISNGKIIKNTYEIDRLIGTGAFGNVYRVTHKFLGYQALKVLKPDILKKNEQNSFINEATILSNITHSNVVRVYDANYFRLKKEKLFYISMEYVSGETLMRMLERKTRLSIEVALSIQKESKSQATTCVSSGRDILSRYSRTHCPAPKDRMLLYPLLFIDSIRNPRELSFVRLLDK